MIPAAAGAPKRTSLIVAAVLFLVMLSVTIALVMPRKAPWEEPACPMGGDKPAGPAMVLGSSATVTITTRSGPAATATASVPVPPTAAAATASVQPALTPTAAPAPAAVKPPAAPDTDANAAAIYRKAFERMVVAGRNTMARIERVAAIGWEKQDKAVFNALVENQPALAVLLQAAACTRCQFLAESALIEGDAAAPHLAPSLTLATLAVADGRMLAAQGDRAAAVDRYLAVVRMAQHLRSDRTLECLEHSQTVLGLAFPALADLLEAGRAGVEPLQKIHGEARTLNREYPSLGEAMAGAVSSVRRQVRALVRDDAYLTGETWRAPLPSRTKAMMLRVPVAERKQYVSTVLRAFDDRCVRILAAAQGMRRADIDSIRKAFDSTRLQASTPNFGLDPEEMGAFLAMQFVPRIEPLWQNETHDLLRRRALLCLAALRLCRSRTDVWPDKLQALVPRALTAVPKDPFDPAHGILRYRAVQGEAVLWSVGVNGKDDAPAAQPQVGVPDKDVVFWLR